MMRTKLYPREGGWRRGGEARKRNREGRGGREGEKEGEEEGERRYSEQSGVLLCNVNELVKVIVVLITLTTFYLISYIH